MRSLLRRSAQLLVAGCVLACYGTARGLSPKRIQGPGQALAGRMVAAAAAPEDPGSLISTMASNEVAAHKQETRYSYLAEERSTRTGGHLWREKVVETSEGPLHRLLAIDGRPLSPAEFKAEADRVAEVINHPEAFRRLNAAHQDDEAHAALLLQLLPKAFLLAPAGEENGCERFAFRPNPAFQPSTYEERAIHAMGGTVSLKAGINRLCNLNAKVLAPVEFGYGFLGRIDGGSFFGLERVPVDGTNWKSDHISVHVEGKILMMKSLTREQEVRRTDIQVIPQHLSLAQAAQLSLQ